MVRAETALITGGSGTIGRAIGMALAVGGTNVVLCGRRAAPLDAAAAAIHAASGGRGGGVRGGSVSTVIADVTREDEVAKAFEEAASRHERVDLLVNCAGIAIGGPTTDLAPADFARVIEVNVLGTFVCSREAFRHMGARGGGRIINVGSISAFAPRPDSAAYTSSKFALDGLTRSLALDGRPLNIAVGAIHPGNVESEIMSAEEAERRRQTEGFIEADDVAACVLQMASLPLGANVLELTVMPTAQPLVGRG